jgi:uncharacterized protein YkuJ
VLIVISYVTIAGVYTGNNFERKQTKTCNVKATSENSRFTLQTDKNKINSVIAPYKFPYFTFTTHYALES